MYIIGFGILINEHIQLPNFTTFSIQAKHVIFYKDKYIIKTTHTITEDEFNSIKLNDIESSQFILSPVLVDLFNNKLIKPELLAFKFTLKLITFNLAKNVQLNRLRGSEKSYVELCQKKYSGGWTNIPNCRLSQATYNAISWLKSENADLIALQEVVNENMFEMLAYFDEKYDVIGDNSNYFIYNTEIFGEGQLISSTTIIDYYRPLIIVYFPKLKTLAINLHAPHNINLTPILENIIQRELNSIKEKINRIIVMGDFNDTYGHNVTSLKVLNQIVTHNPTNVKGDYILDSYMEDKTFYGIPVLDRNILMSDHKPVISY